MWNCGSNSGHTVQANVPSTLLSLQPAPFVKDIKPEMCGTEASGNSKKKNRGDRDADV